MKNLEAYMKNLYISLEGIDEELKEKIKNLDNYEINECCGCCELSGANCYDPDSECCDKCCEPNLAKIPTQSFGRFNSDNEVTRELDSCPKVQTLFDISKQFGEYHYSEYDNTILEPLYFGLKDPYTCIVSVDPSVGVTREMGDMPYQEAEPTDIPVMSVPTRFNKKIHDFVIEVCRVLELERPVIQTKINGEVQVHALFFSGTNGKENSIKSSLERVAKLLGKLESRSEIKWAQVLDVSINNLDDLYGFYITFVLDGEKVKQEIKTNKIK